MNSILQLRGHKYFQINNKKELCNANVKDNFLKLNINSEALYKRELLCV